MTARSDDADNGQEGDLCNALFRHAGLLGALPPLYHHSRQKAAPDHSIRRGVLMWHK